MISKRYSRDDIISKFKDDQTILFGGFAFHGLADELIECILESGAKHLTIIGLDASGIKLAHEGRVDKMIFAHAGAIKENLELVSSGKVEVELCPMGTVAERIRAGGMGLGGILVKTGLGTIAEKGKKRMVLDGQEYILEKAIRGDVSIVKCHACDPYGNLTYLGTNLNSNNIVAMAGDTTIVQTDKFVDMDTFPPEAIVTPGVFVDMILDPSL